VVVLRYASRKAENRDRFSLAVLLNSSAVACIGAIWLAFTHVGPIGFIAVQIAGLVIMGGGIFLRSTAIAQLGRFHSPNVAIRDDHHLVDVGLYRFVRHPSYLGAIIAYIGFGLALGNWFSFAALTVIPTLAYVYRMHEEEAALAAAFGDDYSVYCRRTKRLIPGLY
jgi:protein-S-isoprenylcysteine O-methyltransferase